MLDLCRSPELACEVTLQPIDEFGFDAAILFSDILITLPAMEIEVAFPEAGPKIGTPIRSHDAIEALHVPDPEAELPFVMAAVRTIKAALAGRVRGELSGSAGEGNPRARPRHPGRVRRRPPPIRSTRRRHLPVR